MCTPTKKQSESSSRHEQNPNERHKSNKGKTIQQHLTSATLLAHCPQRPAGESLKAWFSGINWNRSRKIPGTMPRLPSPDDRSVVIVTSTQRSTASVHDFNYRTLLEKYNIHVPGQRPPPGFREEAERIIFRRRGSSELDDAAVDELRQTMNELHSSGEEEVRARLGVDIIPGYKSPSDKRLAVVHGQPWNMTAAIPLHSSVIQPPLPLPIPKPDSVFSFSKAAFNSLQLVAIDALVQSPGGPSFATPYLDLPFPFAVVEYKSQSTSGTTYVANNQAAGAGAVALNGFFELLSRGPGLDPSHFNKPLFFSVALDQNCAFINVGWVSEASDTGERAFHLEELLMLPLGYGDSIRVLQRALKNIQEYAANDILKLVVDALEEYRHKPLKHKNANHDEQSELESHAAPSSPSPPPNKRARRAVTKPHSKETRKRTRPAQSL